MPQQRLQLKSSIVALIRGFEAEYTLLGNSDSTFYFHTDQSAPRGRVVAIDIGDPRPDNWEELIPEAEQTLTDVNLVGHQFFAEYLQDATTRIKRYDLSGTHLGDVKLPGLGNQLPGWRP